MPTYTYECKKCAATTDVFHGMSASPRVKCPECGGACRRLIGTGAGVIFRGSGFYETDYKKSAASKEGGKSSEPKTATSGEAPKGEAKTEAKTEPTKPAQKAAND